MTDLTEASPPAQWEAMAAAELEMSARLCAGIEDLAARMTARADFLDRLGRAMHWVPAPAFPLSALPYVPPANGGPGMNFAWAIQRVTVGPIGATTDAVTIYKGRSVVDVAPQNALATFTGAAGAFVPWTPGHAGVILMPGESLIAAGTITGANPVLSWDVKIMDLDALPFYLL
jgi:hypothetical protein